jgi:hypothetical protein
MVTTPGKAGSEQSHIPAARNMTEFDVTLDDIKEVFFETWPLIFNLDIAGYSAIQSGMCYTEAGIIAIYLCGRVMGSPDTDRDPHIISVFDAWKVAQECIPTFVKEA